MNNLQDFMISKVRVKMMCEIMIDSYGELLPSTLTDKSLLKSSKKNAKKVYSVT